VTRLLIVAGAAIGLILFVAFGVSKLLESRTRGISIRMQVFLALAVIVGAFAFGLGIMVIDRVEARAVRLATQAARDEASAIARIAEGELVRSGASVEDVAQRWQGERNRGADLQFELLDKNGTPIFPAGRSAAPEEPGMVSVDTPIYKSGLRVGSVRVIKPTMVMRRLLADFAPTVLVISLVLGAAAALAAGWIGRAIARPIEAMSAFSERVSSGERTAAPTAVFGREVTRLARSIDSMRRQLEGRPFVETFAADLSHELKNPVAAIRASAELLEEGAIDEPENARRFIARIREATERIERLLGELMSLARIEARGAETVEPVELVQLVETAVRGFYPERVRVDVEGLAQGDSSVRGDPTWLSRAISNLLDNAFVHSPPQTPIEVRVSRAESGVVLTVRSSGAIPRHVRTSLFRRFVTTRADKGGSGLGLAIVRAVAEAHGGSVELAEPGPPQVTFRLALPGARGASRGSFQAEPLGAVRGEAAP
jgi:signal transduction histidine kinase